MFTRLLLGTAVSKIHPLSFAVLIVYLLAFVLLQQASEQFKAQYFHAFDYAKSYVCDSCGGSVWSSRYRCMDCKDYDLCRRCFISGVMPRDSSHSAEHSLVTFWFVTFVDL
jgi:hypothetical protein